MKFHDENHSLSEDASIRTCIPTAINLTVQVTAAWNVKRKALSRHLNVDLLSRCTHEILPVPVVFNAETYKPKKLGVQHLVETL